MLCGEEGSVSAWGREGQRRGNAAGYQGSSVDGSVLFFLDLGSSCSAGGVRVSKVLRRCELMVQVRYREAPRF